MKTVQAPFGLVKRSQEAPAIVTVAIGEPVLFIGPALSIPASQVMISYAVEPLEV